MATEDEVVVDTRVVPVEAGGTGEAPPDAVVDTSPKANQKPIETAPNAPQKTPVVEPTKVATALDVEVGDATKTAQGIWGDDWREKLAGGDEKKLARYSKYASPQALADALVNAQTLISKGEHKKALPVDATPEAMAEWRKNNGIPDKPENYKIDVGAKINPRDQQPCFW